MRKITYKEAIAEATVQAMDLDPRVFVFGLGVDDAKGIFGTTRPAFLKFGKERVMDIPLAEEALTGVAIGAAINGKRPLMVHMRCDFMYVSMDQIVNHAAFWSYTFGGAMKVPLVIRAIIGRGWGQASQHSQSPQALFNHIPGLKIVMPASPIDAKGLLLQCLLYEQSPVIFLEHRSLYDVSGDVPEKPFRISLGEANIIKTGKDVTIVTLSYMAEEAKKANVFLEREGIDAEIIDLRSIKPWDKDKIFESVRKTGRLVIADTAWKTNGVSAEISASVNEEIFYCLKGPILRVASPDAPVPCSSALQKEYYPGPEKIVAAAYQLLGLGAKKVLAKEEIKEEFKGPF